MKNFDFRLLCVEWSVGWLPSLLFPGEYDGSHLPRTVPPCDLNEELPPQVVLLLTKVAAIETLLVF